MPEPKIPETPEDRLATLRREIAARLQGVCDHWPREEFDALVAEIARITHKYDFPDERSEMINRRIRERMLEKLKAAADLIAKHHRAG